MKYSATLCEKEIQIEVSDNAEKALLDRDKPIVAVVHLIFGCMVAKRVWFKEQVADETTMITDKLALAFNVVRYAVCSIKNIDGGAEPEEFPLGKDKKNFVPDYLFIDYRKSDFTGDFTYDRSSGSNLTTLNNQKDIMVCSDSSRA